MIWAQIDDYWMGAWLKDQIVFFMNALKLSFDSEFHLRNEGLVAVFFYALNLWTETNTFFS